MGVGASIPLKLRSSLVGYFDGLSTWSQAGNRADRSVHRKQWSSLFFTLTTAFLDLGCWKWHVRAPSQWLISCDVQPEGLHSVNRPPRPSLCPLFEQLQEVGYGFVKSPFDFVGLEKGLLFVAKHRVRELFSSIWTLFTKRHLQGKLKFDAIECQDLFCNFFAYTWAHTFEKFSGVYHQRVLGRQDHLPGSQVIFCCPGPSV